MPTTLLDQLKSRRPTQPLYHYTSTEGLIGILQKKCLRASAIHYLNDTAEYQHAASVARKLLGEYIYLRTGPPIDLCDRALRSLNHCMDGTAFAASLSAEKDKLSQWRAYCPNGGFSIGFAPEVLERQAEKQGFATLQCIYDQAAQAALCAELIAHGCTAAQVAQPDPKVIAVDNDPEKRMAQVVAQEYAIWQGFSEPFVGIAASLKNPCFQEENEWRVVSGPFGPMQEPPPDVCFRAGKYTAIPYLEFKLADSDAPLEVEEIVIGPNPDAQLARKSINYLLRSLNARCNKISEYSGTLRT